MAEQLSEEVPWLEEIQRPPRHMPSGVPELPSLLLDADSRSITTKDAWELRRAELRRWWLDFLGSFEFDRQPPPPLEVIDEDRSAGVIRMLIRYEVEPGCLVEAYLLKPIDVDGPLPGVVVFHPTVPYTIRQPAGLEGQPEKAFGLKLAQRGCIALCPRCFLWRDDRHVWFRWHVRQQVKELRNCHPRAKGMAKMLHDAQVALDVLANLPDVDPRRLGAVGHSLGAKQALYLAALDQRVRVAVSSEGGIGKEFSNWSAPWYLGHTASRQLARGDHHELLAMVAPRAFLLVGGDSADGDRSWPFIQAALPIYRLHDGCPRIGLLNHRRGHTVPAEVEPRIYEWFATYL